MNTSPEISEAAPAVPLPPRPTVDTPLIELVDAIVDAVDANRSTEVDRVRSALGPFGGSLLFDAEIRLNGFVSLHEGCICGGEVA